MEKNLNVLLVVPWDQESGGVAAVVGYLARHLEREGNRVLFLHPGSSEVARRRKTKLGFDGVELKMRAPFNPRFPLRSVITFVAMFPFTLLQILLLLRRNAIDVVNIHYPGEHFVYFAFCRFLLRVRLVISIHGTDAIRYDAPPAERSMALRMLFRAADLVIAPSWRFLRRCSDLLAPFEARRVAIHNGADVAELHVETAEPMSEPMILSVCSLDEWKGVDVLIRAIALLRDAGQRARLVVAGEGPQRAALEGLIAELHLDDSVALAGQQSRAAVAKLLHQCTVFVLASRFETFGIAALEAMAVGKAVVGTNVDGMLEIIEHGDTGIIVDTDDPPKLAGAIHRLLTDSDLRNRLGHAARARVRDHFQRSKMGDNYLHAFREVTHGV